MEDNKLQDRLVYLDYLKTIAITLVITYHCLLVSNVVVSALLSMCVTIFFCVNGFLMLRKHRNAKYLLRKSMKLIMLILFWGGISSVIGMLTKEDAGISVKTTLLHLYNLDVGYGNQMWFLCTLVILNFFNPPLYYFLKSASKTEKIVFIVFIGVCSVNVIRFIAWRFNPLGGWAGYALLYYILGYVCLSNDRLSKYYIRYYAIAFLAFVAMQAIYNYALLHYEYYGDIVFGQYASIFVVGSTLSLLLLFKSINLKENIFISFVGKNTLGIYMIQDVVIKSMFELHLNEQPIILTLISFSMCCLLVYLFNKTRFTRFLISI